MILTEAMRKQMQEATRTLISGSVGVATEEIQKALKDMPTMTNFLRDANVGNLDLDERSRFASAEAMPAFVKDLLAQLGIPFAKHGREADQNVRTTRPTAPITQAEEVAATNHGQFLKKSFTNRAGTRSYKLFIPSSYHGQAMPLVIMLHGCTQNPDDFANGTRMNIMAEESQCFVAYPAQTKAANSSKCWNWFNSVDQQREQGEPSIIAGITQEIVSNYKLDCTRVYVAGLSSGGAMAVIMATTYSDLYAAAGVHSGLPYGSARDLPSAFVAMRGSAKDTHNSDSKIDNFRSSAIPIIIFHGDNDTTVNFSNSEYLMKQNAQKPVFDRNNTGSRIKPYVIIDQGQAPNGHRYTRTSHQDGDGCILAEHWVIHGAGHAWAGGSSSGSYTDPKGPDATREMLRFFYSHAKTAR